MSGHSKWSTIKRKKAVTDAARGKMFSKYIKEITMAARIGGGDAATNPRLRTAILASKSVNMPAVNIERAIKKGSGELEGSHYEEVHYEGYGPSGVAMLIECATDNHNRTTAEVRNILTKYGGNMAAAGAVSYLFKQRGLFIIDRAAIAEDALMELVLEAGADDVQSDDEHHEVYTPPSAFEAVRAVLEAKQVPTVSGESTKLATLLVPVTDREGERVLRLVDLLEDNDDVQKVFTNAQLPDSLLAKLSE
jgi:YebC/PmpR family DNA-binding regulatory protein